MANGPTTDEIPVETVTRTKDEVVATRQALVVSTRTGVLTPRDMSEALEYAQNMAKGQSAVPVHLRGHPGACLAVVEYAGAWGLLPYAVANQSYVVKDRLCFMGQLVHSVIKSRAPLRYPKLGLECEYQGQGPTRKCIVWAECYIDDERKEMRVLKWESPEFKDIQPKNSPLWESDPDQQLFYRTSQRWQRRYFPEILLGIHTKEEIEDMTEEERAEFAKDVSPTGAPRLSGLAQRLGPRRTQEGDEGFSPDNVQNIAGDRQPGGPIIDSKELDEIAADVEERVADAMSMAALGAAQAKADTPSAAVPSKADGDGTEPGPEGQKTAPVPAATVAVTPAAKPAEPEKKDPTDEEGYQAHLVKWLWATQDDAYIHDRYAEEKALRTRCGADITACQALKKKRLTELGSP